MSSLTYRSSRPDSWVMPRPSTSILAWVPLPAPGGPRRMMFIAASPSLYRFARPFPRNRDFSMSPWY